MAIVDCPQFSDFAKSIWDIPRDIRMTFILSPISSFLLMHITSFATYNIT